MSLRVLIAVTHLLGAGHLTRAAAVARAFAQAGHEITLISGGTPVPLASLDGIALVQLPPVRILGTDFKTLLDEAGDPVDETYLARRRTLLLETLNAARPDILITELFPFGRRVLTGEFAALVDAARRMRPRTLILCSIRDILAAPSKPERIEAAHERLIRDYDAVLVHGDPQLIPLDASWPVDARIAPMLRYTGYVDEDASPSIEGSRSGIMVSGGSSAASLPLYRAALDAARDVTDRPWRILIGRGVDEADFQSLRSLEPSHAIVERARPDFRALLSHAEVSVSQAGYNTVVDILRSGVTPVLVPFEGGRETEQRLRAERLRALGLAEVLNEADLSPRRLVAAIRRRLAREPAPPRRISTEGAQRSVSICERLALATPALHRTIDWSSLDRALSRARERDCPIGFWWRDDDASAHTPELDRLLGLAHRHKAGVALAAIPQRLERSLADRLDGEETAFVLVHGSSHANHAPPGEKKAEFGGHRPVDAMAMEAAAALKMARDLLGSKLLPVFVPPWNRIAPSLMPCLPSSGYDAVSTFRDRPASNPAQGLIQINTHIDPIDWRGTRSLAEPEEIVSILAGAVERRVEGVADKSEPIGFLTHHLVHDEAIWSFCELLMIYLAEKDIHFLRIDELFRNKSRIASEL
jgi:predicted glycosyltransferase